MDCQKFIQLNMSQEEGNRTAHVYKKDKLDLQKIIWAENEGTILETKSDTNYVEEIDNSVHHSR